VGTNCDDCEQPDDDNEEEDAESCGMNKRRKRRGITCRDTSTAVHTALKEGKKVAEQREERKNNVEVRRKVEEENSSEVR